MLILNFIDNKNNKAVQNKIIKRTQLLYVHEQANLNLILISGSKVFVVRF